MSRPDFAFGNPIVSSLTRRLKQRRPVEAEVKPGERQAAVAAVLRVAAEPELLFIKRAEVERDPWSGHMAFPGGRRELLDDTLQDTAIRETREEVELKLDRTSFIGQLDDLAPRSLSLPRIVVRPFVAIVAPDVALHPGDEVAATFWVPLAILRDPSSQGEHVMTVNGVRARFPAYRVDEHLVWGLTERIVRQLLSMVG